jgi:hypothetical protein
MMGLFSTHPMIILILLFDELGLALSYEASHGTKK